MRRGFTLLELIIVVSIIVVLVILLLPQVCKVRHAAVIASCSNNLRQISTATHGYRDAQGYFPPGTMPHPTLPANERLSWQVSLLPYMDLRECYDKFQRTATWNVPANEKAHAACPMPTFRCPAYMAPWTEQTPTTYIGIAGVGADAATLPFDAPGVGFFGYDRRLKLEQIKDGTAQTLMVIESSRDVGPWVRGGSTTVRGLDLSDEPLLGEGRPFGGLHQVLKTFGGMRSLGTQMLMADGSVHMAAVHVDAAVLGVALATIAGGEEVPAGW